MVLHTTSSWPSTMLSASIYVYKKSSIIWIVLFLKCYNFELSIVKGLFNAPQNTNKSTD